MSERLYWPGDWVLDAVCAETDPEKFFPEQGQSSKRAKRVCAGCPVRQPCLEFAMAHSEPGVWGGTTAEERKRLRPPVAKPMDGSACGTERGYHQHWRRGERACAACTKASADATRRRRQSA